MAVCDICNSPGMGTLISAEQMRSAVFQKGFNPFKLKLASNSYAFMGISEDQTFQNWKNTIVAQDTSDWNICSKCMGVLKNYMTSTPKPTGVANATVSSNPLIANAKAQEVENSFKKIETNKWWQFWK
ncbi:MAG: hypothetical protein JXB00_12190 [Bacteroidales bacterium]|nr:hypothetical protein [Bacteroidales bacterium]